MRYSALLSVLLVFSGCTTTSLFSKFAHKPKFPKATAANPAVRCLCLWEPSEGIGVDNLPSRGVSGQIFFFTRNGASPVEVDGDTRIYLFDDEGSAGEQTHPLHQFDFMAGSWQTHLTSTQFGPAYQLFVPYSRKGRHQAELALRVRLTPPNGLPLYSEMARITLPGHERAKTTDGSDTDEHQPPTAESSDNNVSQHQGITPEMIGDTLLQVLAERHATDGPNDTSLRSTRRPARQIPRTVAKLDSENED
jgi:hypothetical protein